MSLFDMWRDSQRSTVEPSATTRGGEGEEEVMSDEQTLIDLEEEADVANDRINALEEKLRLAEFERDRLRVVVDELAKRGKTTFMVTFRQGSLVVTGPTGREEDMAQTVCGLYGATVSMGKDIARENALKALVTGRYLYGLNLGRGWNGCIYDALNALAPILADMEPDEAFNALKLGDEEGEE